uniref:polynucleotide adenylyltransferase n=1 Tax=Coccidioides posadasii RMSCC 3488 TaxID=454284 RepID=A0A0J6IKL9_COCPO|nr:hypothetical protein CPAG_08791 [Coccidioides posadasii RMSCC 3488]
MASSSDQLSSSKSLSLRFKQTALCIVPPEGLCGEIDRLRSFYDQTYGRWPPHVNLLYPFVAGESLLEATALIGAKLKAWNENSGPPDISIRLDKADYIAPGKGNLVHLVPRSLGDGATLQHLRNVILEALGQDDTAEYNPHLTVGQTKAHNDHSRDSLLSKSQLLSAIEWKVERLVVLIRENARCKGSKFTRMRVWGTIDLSGRVMINDIGNPCDEESWYNSETVFGKLSGPEALVGEEMTTYQFPLDSHFWRPCAKAVDEDATREPNPDIVAISSYNVLVELPYPPPRERYPALVRNILSQSALADVLVLQEVCDDFLSHLLTLDEIRNHYTFATHGPPHQEGCGPLPLQRNVVVLSRFKFTWENVTFGERYKSAIVLKVNDVGKRSENSEFLPLIIAAVHLTSGLADSRVSSKESQIRSLYKFLDQNYPKNPCLIAGDINIPTSAITIQKAIDERLLSPEKAKVLPRLESLLSEYRFQDAWVIARAGAKDLLSAKVRIQRPIEGISEGEEGATFDPKQNPLAAASAGLEGRPQRYDRILTDRHGNLRVTEFNMFGFPDEDMDIPYHCSIEDETAETRFGSDHWGVRATFKVLAESQIADTTADILIPSSLATPANLSDKHDLDLCLREHSMVPTKEDISKRTAVLDLLRNVIIHGSAARVEENGHSDNEPDIAMVLVPVGSYGLGVWSPSSDVDCLSIGPISSKIFFAIAEQRLRRAADSGIRILRKVKAATGTMIELEVNGIKCDLQYCPAARVVEGWQRISLSPPDDPIFDLSYQALTKLQAFRDLDYIRRSIPDLAAFRKAHRFITAWAKHRGVYLSRFGYLGGIHITMMLSRVFKLFCGEVRVTSTDMIYRFFQYYADFDWEHETVFDPFFFESTPRYRRYANEPMVILTINVPLINVARATAGSARTIVEELRRMAQLMSDPDMTWSKLLNSTVSTLEPSEEFLTAYSSYIKIHVQYWGISLAKGKMLLGWLESRCVRLLNDIDRKLPSIYARIWPARFSSKDAMSDDSEYQGCYLIGLTKRETERTEAMTKEERKQSLDLMTRVLEKFKTQIQEETKYFDPTTAWLDVTHVKQSELGALKLDGRDWGECIPTEELSDSEDEEEENIDIQADEVAAAVAAERAARKSGSSKAAATGVPGAKLRPAADILSRLRWDPNIDSGDFVVGYDDRFLGSLEIPLDNWKTEQTDEEFIPQHRILYFRRKSDGVVIWDRESKKDLVFGSGVMPENQDVGFA